jgi:hypothetical protein
LHELSLHILDLLQNSLEAGATEIMLLVEDNPADDLLTFTVEDNGRGMTAEMAATAASPFCTGRKTRRVGLGLSLLAMAAEACNGGVRIDSLAGKGTRVAAVFRRSHPDRQPLGDLPAAITCALAGEEGLTLVYRHLYGGRQFLFSTSANTIITGSFQAGSPAQLLALENFFREQLKILYGGEQ